MMMHHHRRPRITVLHQTTILQAMKQIITDGPYKTTLHQHRLKKLALLLHRYLKFANNRIPTLLKTQEQDITVHLERGISYHSKTTGQFIHIICNKVLVVTTARLTTQVTHS